MVKSNPLNLYGGGSTTNKAPNVQPYGGGPAPKAAPKPASVKLRNGAEIKGCKAQDPYDSWNFQRANSGEQFGQKAIQCNDNTDRFVYSTSNLFGKTTQIYNPKKGEVKTYTKSAWKFLTNQPPAETIAKVTTIYTPGRKTNDLY